MEPPHRRGAGSDQGPQPQPRGQPRPACSAPAEGRGSADSGGLGPGVRGVAARAAQDKRVNIQRKRVSFVSKENTACKYMKTSSEITQKSICTVSKKEEKLLEKRKLSKLERHINAVITLHEEVFSKIAVHRENEFCELSTPSSMLTIMLPSSDDQNMILNHPGHSAFFPNIINTQGSFSNTFLLSSHTGFTSANVSGYKSSDEVRLNSVERQNSATTKNSVILHYQIPTQAEMTRKVQTFKQFPHQPPLPRILPSPELAENQQNCSSSES